jgi:hypothetical protein
MEKRGKACQGDKGIYLYGHRRDFFAKPERTDDYVEGG